MVLAVLGGYCPINGSMKETPRKNNMKTAKTLPVYDATISSQDPHFTDEDTEVPRDQEPGLKSQAWEGPARLEPNLSTLRSKVPPLTPLLLQIGADQRSKHTEMFTAERAKVELSVLI